MHTTHSVFIANPLYQASFQYLMEDNDSAKLLLGAIMGEEVIELELFHRPTYPKQWVTQHLDYFTTLKNKAGEVHQLRLEVQKADFIMDIPYFRGCLAAECPYLVETNRESLPVQVVCFLLQDVLEGSQAPVIHIRHGMQDLDINEHSEANQALIDSLPDNSYIVQLAYFSPALHTELEKLLQIFDRRKIHGEGFRLKIDAATVPERYHPLLLCLRLAATEAKIEEQMDGEDYILSAFQEQERNTAHYRDKLAVKQ